MNTSLSPFADRTAYRLFAKYMLNSSVHFIKRIAAPVLGALQGPMLTVCHVEFDKAIRCASTPKARPRRG